MSLKNDLKEIYTAAIDAAAPGDAVRRHLSVSGPMLTLRLESGETEILELDSFRRIFVVGGGKASASMARAVEEILGDRISGGCVSVKYGHVDRLERIELVEAGHPLPDENGVTGALKIHEILKGAGVDDLVISLISGGGSALMPLPPDSIQLQDKQKATDLLIKCGASIHEINSVRKHLSVVKGGNMARTASPARVINLMISDVVGDNMDVIASGPFVPDSSTFRDAFGVLEKYSISDSVPGPVLDYIKRGMEGGIQENPWEGEPLFKKIINIIIASNILSLRAACTKAEKLGYNSIVLSSLIEGDTAEAALWHSRIAAEICKSSLPVERPACIITGGETTVKVTGKGAGGRNTEFALYAAKYIEGLDDVAVASVGTDGSDGPTDAAGAEAFSDTAERARACSLDLDRYAFNNDSYNFFKELGDLVVTGPTNTNVMDVRIVLVGKSEQG